MSGRGKRAGTDRERKVRAWYADRDWLAFRAPASLGCADVIAMRSVTPYCCPECGSGPSTVELVEVKSTAQGPYEHFGPADRKRLSDAARVAGARAVLCWYPPRGKMVFLYEDSWPASAAGTGAPKTGGGAG